MTTKTTKPETSRRIALKALVGAGLVMLGGFKYESRQVLSRIVLREEYESRGIFGADD